MSAEFGKFLNAFPKFLLGSGLILLAALVASLIWPHLQRDMLVVEPLGENHKGAGTSEENDEETSGGETASVGTGDAVHSSERVFPVYVTGAVGKPGVYYVGNDAILSDLVALAGGLEDHAARDYINLAMPLAANQMYRIPFEDEVERSSLTVPIQQPPQDSNPMPDSPDLVNINTAGEAELTELSGVGSATARSIIEWRETNGLFRVIEDIMQVPGIKDAKFNQIKNFITVDD